MKPGALEQRAGHVSVDCRGADARAMSEACRSLAIECITKRVDRVVLDARGCEPEGHYALRDAFTSMILAGIPERFRLALITDVPRVRLLFADLQRDLRLLQIQTKLFAGEAEAVEWLLHASAAQTKPASQPAQPQA